MSHLRQRKEMNCLNCGSIVLGRFCQNCGQENIEPKESVWHFLLHFFNDVTHFDGKFFTTLKDLLFKPGHLSREYMNGRRAEYLNPIRMYLFTSFLFFLVFFSSFHLKDSQFVSDDFVLKGKTREQVQKMPQKDFDEFTSLLNNGKPMTRDGFNNYIDSAKTASGIHFTNRAYKSQTEYDSLLKAGVIKHNWLKRKLVNKEIEFDAKYNKDQAKSVKAIIAALIHNFPQMLFVSLPFVALLLKLLYIRHKQFYYVSHAVFTIHFYIFVFIVMLATIGISKLETFTNWNWMGYINGTLTLMTFFYLYKAMRNFYHQQRGKTVLKYFLFLFSFLFLIIFLFIAFLLVSFFQV